MKKLFSLIGVTSLLMASPQNNQISSMMIFGGILFFGGLAIFQSSIALKKYDRWTLLAAIAVGGGLIIVFHSMGGMS